MDLHLIIEYFSFIDLHFLFLNYPNFILFLRLAEYFIPYFKLPHLFKYFEIYQYS